MVFYRRDQIAVALGLSLFMGAFAAWADTRPELTRAPVLLHFVEPVYPATALVRRVAGAVELWIDIGADGRVMGSSVVQAADPALADAALTASRDMLFSPAEIDGAPAAIRIAYTYHFVLPEPPPPSRATLRGQVRGPDGLPAVRALVEASPGDHWVNADDTGAFSLELPPGTYRVRASTPEAQSSAREVVAAAGESVTLDVALAPAVLADSRYQTVVRAAPPPPVVTERTLHSDELERVPGAFGDPLRVLEALPGVGRSPFSNGILVLRGSSPDESGVYLDGHQVPLLYHFGGGPSVIPPDAIDSIAIAPGGFGAKYGRATGGIVDVQSRPGRDDAMHGGASVDLLNAGGALEGPIGALGSYRLSGRRSYIDALIPLIQGDAGERADLTLAPRYYDYHGRADLRPRKGLEVSLVANGSDDRLTFASSQGLDDLPPAFDLHMSSHRLNPRLAADLGDGFTLRVSPAVAWLRTRGATEVQFLELDTRQTSLRADLSRAVADHALTFGLDLVRNDHAFTARIPLPGARDFPSADPESPPTTDAAGSLRVVQTGLFTDLALGVGRARITPGLRVEHIRVAGRAETRIDPRLDVRLRIIEGLVARASGGIYHQLPRPEEIAPATGNPELDLERALQGSLGVEAAFLDTWGFELLGYYKDMENLARPVKDLEVRDGSFRYVRYRSDGEGRSYGAEVMLSRRVLRGAMGWVAYSISRSERRRETGRWQLYARDQTHNLSTVLAVDLPANVRVSGRYRYVTGYPAADIVDAEFDADAARYIPEVSGVQRVPSFQQLDLRAEKAFGARDGMHVVTYLDVQNVTNRRNAEYYEWSYDYSERHEYPGLPILPTVGVEARF